MPKLTKTLQGYINQVPIWGTVSFVAGLITAFIVLSSTHQEDWFFYYIPFKILGAILGYMWVAYWNPGGLVTFHLGKFKPTEDEIGLNDLSLKYRSKMFMLLVPIAYILADLIIGMYRYQTNVSYFDAYFGNIIIWFWIVAATSNGVKYVSAWWNIKRNWNKRILASVVILLALFLSGFSTAFAALPKPNNTGC